MVKEGDIIGFMFEDVRTPLAYNFDFRGSTLYFITMDGADPLPTNGAINDFDGLLYPFDFSLKASYDPDASCDEQHTSTPDNS